MYFFFQQSSNYDLAIFQDDAWCVHTTDKVNMSASFFSLYCVAEPDILI